MPAHNKFPLFAATTIFASYKYKKEQQDEIQLEDKFLKSTYGITYFRGKDQDMIEKDNEG